MNKWERVWMAVAISLIVTSILILVVFSSMGFYSKLFDKFLHSREDYIKRVSLQVLQDNASGYIAVEDASVEDSDRVCMGLGEDE